MTIPKKEKIADTVYNRVRAIVVDKLSVDKDDVGEGSSFVDDLGADSLDLVELIMAFEGEFSTDEQRVEIPDEVAATIVTLKDAVDHLKAKGIKDEIEV